MLRRKPTAIAITSEDIVAFEKSHAEKLAYQHYLKTGEDPDGLFHQAKPGEPGYREQQERLAQREVETGVVDPNDELKPLPGDKARIVRGREERIMGVGGGNSGR